MKIECRRCKKEKEERARGLCGACYVRTGSLGTRDRYALPRNRRKGRQRQRCMMDGCEAVVRGKGRGKNNGRESSIGLCQIHYLRAWRASRSEDGRTDNGGRHDAGLLADGESIQSESGGK